MTSPDRIVRVPGFEVHARLHENGLSVDLDVYECIPQRDGTVLYSGPDTPHGAGTWVDSIEKAQRFMHSFVKWDACAHFWLDDKAALVHRDGPERVQEYADLFPKLMGLARGMMAGRADALCWGESLELELAKP